MSPSAWRKCGILDCVWPTGVTILCFRNLPETVLGPTTDDEQCSCPRRDRSLLLRLHAHGTASASSVGTSCSVISDIYLLLQSTRGLGFFISLQHSYNAQEDDNHDDHQHLGFRALSRDYSPCSYSKTRYDTAKDHKRTFLSHQKTNLYICVCLLIHMYVHTYTIYTHTHICICV